MINVIGVKPQLKTVVRNELQFEPIMLARNIVPTMVIARPEKDRQQRKEKAEHASHGLTNAHHYIIRSSMFILS